MVAMVPTRTDNYQILIIFKITQKFRVKILYFLENQILKMSN